jgi:hypothetical protein
VSIGGPIRSSPGKMFWFASWEGFRRRSSTQIGTSPPLFRNGDFLNLPSGRMYQP